MIHSEEKSVAVVHRTLLCCPIVETESLLVEIPEQVEWFDADICALQSAFQQTPEVFESVGMNLSMMRKNFSANLSATLQDSKHDSFVVRSAVFDVFLFRVIASLVDVCGAVCCTRNLFRTGGADGRAGSGAQIGPACAKATARHGRNGRRGWEGWERGTNRTRLR
jgi:hypothetical protein